MIGVPGAPGFDGEPACWSWEPPAAGAWEKKRDSFHEQVRPTLSKEICESAVMAEWHQGRCAICGCREKLVTDHDHETGLERGLLCRSCNACEGTRDGGIWDRYRQSNPATICGFQCRYFDPLSQEYATPRPRARADRGKWTNNALKGAGI